MVAAARGGLRDSDDVEPLREWRRMRGEFSGAGTGECNLDLLAFVAIVSFPAMNSHLHTPPIATHIWRSFPTQSKTVVGFECKCCRSLYFRAPIVSVRCPVEGYLRYESQLPKTGCPKNLRAPDLYLN